MQIANSFDAQTIKVILWKGFILFSGSGLLAIINAIIGAHLDYSVINLILPSLYIIVHEYMKGEGVA